MPDFMVKRWWLFVRYCGEHVPVPLTARSIGLTVIDKPQFQLQMKGVELAPDTVRASDLATLLVHLEGAIVETAKGQNIPIAFDSDVALVSLVRVEHGSSEDLMFAVARPVSPSVSTMTKLIVDRNFSSLPYKAQEHLHKLYLRGVKKRWSYEFHQSNGMFVAPAIISYEFPVPKPSIVATTKGQSTLWGYLTKVGGDDPMAVLRLRNGRLFTVDVTREIVSELSSQNLLYKDIGLQGVATWRIDDWSLESFAATAVLDYRPDEITLVDTFEGLTRAADGRWDGIDPVDFVDNLRSE